MNLKLIYIQNKLKHFPFNPQKTDVISSLF